MPQQQSLATWFALNGANDPTPSGVVDLRTGDTQFVGGLNMGDYFDLTEQEANEHSFINGDATKPTGISVLLHAGRYRRVQVHPGATAANVACGLVGFMVSSLAGLLAFATSPTDVLNIVTSADTTAGPLTMVRPVVFLNTITPGNYGFIQELGVASVYASAVVTPPANAGVSATGQGTVAAAGTPNIGAYMAPALANTQALVLLNLPVIQG